MSVNKFFQISKPISLSLIIELTGSHTIKSVNTDIFIENVSSSQTATERDLTFLSGNANIKNISILNAKACFITPDLIKKLPNSVIPIITNNPELSFATVLSLFYPGGKATKGSGKISKDAIIEKGVLIEEGVTIEHGAVLKTGVEIGASSIISSNVVIENNVSIGRNCFIGSNSSIMCTLIGDNVIIHPGARIGQDGFGYVLSESGFVKFPQIGKVVIQDNVEIGANSTIDRGALEDTIIGEGSKLDNLVHVAHNVSIGRYCGVAGQVGISGSVKVGDGVMFGGQAGVIPHLSIGNNAQIAAGSGIMHNVNDAERVAGRPHRSIDKYLREVKALARISRK
ncbi:MAG: UDP-3-O-(3-hydroxymyristoyl)glucosamine N-acyltransferase [Rhodobiaceae bacterium]|jgi:UDP-3-O-[3-hydroxymyristoyl] glucosamine N-acyltransferase|nr:UDP-3-O-(3-hydroxymyristoyl)glucosamine N-acyltransferase [Rhodobiaceae bacterium]MBT5640265.1 UDP-3-O-(3-hydroxymyristoyl)glucosamine N-acyltransferase [Rhodobiaceae bacterium]MBT6222963.1 UDP-3-O-(3-hydroxymyristoyl)glucosamine N-acyltransferase [Rhodobiaceae bacterium]MDC3271948.1 UDP-3-O-(3-hydroxymyristoyl)glucosamine N-acyltransferase [Hyphomicrobiales bacterium]|tara:strand:+ start:1006 stop:2028 length:1023 start_codon:yes stop_codon:yes gene_type:complete